MDNKTAIQVNGLSKQYRIGARKERYQTFRDTIAQAFSAPFRRAIKLLQGQAYGAAEMDEAIWAVKDVSFEVKKGEVLGIIGRNGAGKSTLLKILSRITEPTEGEALLYGRVGSLLEVGTGFHFELTGRENIYLSGAILGMRKKEIENKFDEIVSFAEIDKFIDTPIKYYSSGMYVRLAFAVAAHLEPEILLVDEVLAVGDVAFQKKCLGKMETVAGEGRTILFVSHRMETIINLCPRTILLENGKIVEDGPTQKVVDRYLESSKQLANVCLKERKDRRGDGRLQFVDTWVEDKNGKKTRAVQSGDTVALVGEYEILDREKISNITVGYALYGRNNIEITDLSNLITGDFFGEKIPPKGQIRCVIPRLPLNVGIYTYNMIIRSVGMGIEDHVLDAGSFEVEPGDFFGTGKSIDRNRLFLIDHKWDLVSK